MSPAMTFPYFPLVLTEQVAIPVWLACPGIFQLLHQCLSSKALIFLWQDDQDSLWRKLSCCRTVMWNTAAGRGALPPLEYPFHLSQLTLNRDISGSNEWRSKLLCCCMGTLNPVSRLPQSVERRENKAQTMKQAPLAD